MAGTWICANFEAPFLNSCLTAGVEQGSQELVAQHFSGKQHPDKRRDATTVQFGAPSRAAAGDTAAVVLIPHCVGYSSDVCYVWRVTCA